MAAFLKSFIAVFEDVEGISYTYRHPSNTGSKQAPNFGSGRVILRSTDSLSSHREDNPEQIKGWEREEDPIMGNRQNGHEQQIKKTVHYSVENESIELSEGAISG